ncbi:probable RNA-binding protein 46 [Metopolophium dirhodum]|uniref:probable RNA-binding protein 46 n=1 Tax=Metopolophium dirhodum TaxID=44670 RepID=UPI00298F641C|nr:probable RNA-binding protein 46 [Metopolophium dirhodum]
MADLLVDMDYAIMTINSQIVYKPTSQRDDPEPDNDREVYVGNLPQHYTIEKFVNFAKKCGSIYSVRLLKGSGGLNKGFGYIMYRSLAAVDIAIDTYNGTFLPESDTNKPLIEINYFVINHPSLLLKFECEDDSKLFISFKSLK